MKYFILLMALLFLLCGCGNQEIPETIATVPSISETIPTTEPTALATEPTVPPAITDPIQDMINAMSLEERVGQLFLARCDDSVALEHIQQYHISGFILFGRDFQNETVASITEKISTYQSNAQLPLLIAVDEEGGTVTRVSSYPAFRSSKFSSPRQLYQGGGMDWVLFEETEKCLLLTSLGINVNLGPVCDISLDPSAFMYRRSLGQTPEITSDYVTDVIHLMNSHSLGSCLKHFPGYGNNPDTHVGIATDNRSLRDLEKIDLKPFAAGIQAGCDSILVSHTIVECLDPDYPASLSPAVHDYLRNIMNFQGVIITDDLVMEAITEAYGAREAAILAVLAGNDLLCSTEYTVQYSAVLDAVLDGRIDMDTLNSAVRNVLEWKQELGLILVG